MFLDVRENSKDLIKVNKALFLGLLGLLGLAT